jgi:hypothetical protein
MNGTKEQPQGVAAVQVLGLQLTLLQTYFEGPSSVRPFRLRFHALALTLLAGLKNYWNLVRTQKLDLSISGDTMPSVRTWMGPVLNWTGPSHKQRRQGVAKQADALIARRLRARHSNSLRAQPMQG